METKVTKTLASNQGIIYVFDNQTCLKKYKDITNQEQSIFEEIPKKISIEIIEYFEKLNNKHICKILKTFYKNNEITGYLMPYYNEVTPNILDFDTDYLTRNFTELYELILRLSYDGIRVVDLNPNNLILTKDNIIIIDFDKYRYEKDLDLNILLEINKQALLYALTKKIEQNLSLKEETLSKDTILNYINSMITIPASKPTKQPTIKGI